jgi:site-specific recombinase XerD
MHEAFWNGLFDTRWEDAPLGRESIRLALWLRKRGHSERSYRAYAHAVVHLGRVLHEAQAEVTAGALDEAVVADFIGQHLPVCCCYHRRPGRRAEHVRRGLAHLLAMLREEGVIAYPVQAQPVYHELLEDYCRFLHHDRGLAKGTTTLYRRYVRDFLISRGDAVSPGELAQLTADDLLAFSRQRGAALGATAWNHLATSLSGFYRWLDLCGHGGRHLFRAVPLRRRYRLADVPCALSWDQVQRLLAVVDRREVNGRRNYAMLLLAATYGLRSCEVRVLRLDDINWSDDEITIFAPKTGRSRKLPLTRPVGEAILDYLREERPPSHHREVFLSSHPPHGPFRSKINRWLARCFDKAGIEALRRGTHTLRHSLAVQLLRSGETLKSIGDVLGHQSPETTFIYTKLNVVDLRTVALEPEEVVS